MTIRRFGWDRLCIGDNFFETRAVWCFRGTSVAVSSGESEGQCKFNMVAGVMLAGMMQQWFRLVEGRVRAVRYHSSMLLSASHTMLIFSAPVIAKQMFLANSMTVVGHCGVGVDCHHRINQSMSQF